MFVPQARASNAWGCYHWARTSNPFTLKLGDNVSFTWDSYLATTTSISIGWSASTKLDTTIVTGQTNPRPCRPTSGRVEVCDASYGNTGWLGLAQIWVNGCHITQGVAKVNDTYFDTLTYNTPGWRNLVMCQEVGHTLGLDHQDTNFNNTNLGTCMDYTSNPYGPPDNEYPNQHDYDELDIIYGHLDSTTTVSNATATQHQPPAMNDLDLSAPGQWGKLVRSTNGGRTELYELDFGGEHKVFTFVIWADGNGRGRGR
ncbi:MAG: hypothetical protein HY238_12100 [Acidobacteria bacterium]|nr:hypothetical protein [Acidobacteriota bacterium]